MLRGFRWQLVALLTAAGLFAVLLLTRSTDIPTPAPTLIADTNASDVPAAIQTSTPVPADVSAQQVVAAPAGDGIVTYREGLVGAVQRLNPLFAALNPVDRDITSLIFEGLTTTNQYGEPAPALASSWVISSDGLEYIVRLREDVLWQDGIPFSANDVIYTMSILRSTDFPGTEALGAFWRTVETEKLGEHLVRFRLTQRLSSFLDALRIGILPVHALEGTGAAQLASHPFNLTPIGTGPYQLEALRADESGLIRMVDLRVAPVYRQRPEGQSGYALERLRFHLYDSFDEARAALESGALDGLAARDRRERRPLLALDNTIPYTAIQPELGAIIFNWANEETRFFREQRVRVALEIGIDRSSVVERRLTNEAVRADSPIMPGSWAYIPDLPWPAHDPGAARGLLATAYERALETEAAADTAENDAEATPDMTAEPRTTLFDFAILTPDDPALAPLAQELATQWSQYGLGVTVEAVDPATYQARLQAGEFEAALVELALGDSADPDVYPFWHQGQAPSLDPSGRNYGSASDRRISELLERARQDVSGVNRVEFYHEFQRAFVDRAIAIPMYYPLFTYTTAADVNGVQLGFIGSPADRFRTIRDWSKLAG